MALNGQSACYSINTFFWKIFGIWPGRTPSNIYKYFSFAFLTVTLVIYLFLLILNLFYAPMEINKIIPEGIFFFTEVAVGFKVFMILSMRKKVFEVFDLLDCKQFQGNDHVGRYIIEKNKESYRIFWTVLAVMSHFAYFLQCVLPALLYFIKHKDIDLPISQYFFLSDEFHDNYFMIWFIYQSVGIYVHMMYNVNIDTFIAGLILMAIVQLKILKHNFSIIKVDPDSVKHDSTSQRDVSKLNELLYHYDLTLEYCSLVQEIISLTMFIQFCMATGIICVMALLMTQSTESIIFLFAYSSIMVMQIFLPAWLGTQLTYESQELLSAAYNSDWISRSEPYKRNLRLFMERAVTPVVISGLKVLPLTLSTFLSIIKMAYSFFTLLRKVQDRQA